MKKLYPFLVLLVPVLMFAQQDMNTMMTSDTTAMMEDTTAVMEETAPAMEEEPMYDTTMFGEETEAPAMEDEYMVESEGAKALGITAGVNLGYPVYMSSGMTNKYDGGPQFGLIVGTPYGLEVGPLSFGLGVEIGMYSFPKAAAAEDLTGVQVLAFVNTLLANTGAGPVSAQVGAGYFGEGLGVTAGVSYDYDIPNMPLLIRVYGRGNASTETGAGVGTAGWLNVGAMISYDLSGMF